MPTTNIPILDHFALMFSRNMMSLEQLIKYTFPKLLKHPAYDKANMTKIFLQYDKETNPIIIEVVYIRPCKIEYYE